MGRCDAAIIGAGHNGLVAANVLADAGWDVVVVEAAPVPGGAVRSEPLAPGYTVDPFSSFFPMAAASPVMASMDLEAHGLRWSHAPSVLAHVRAGAPAALLHRDVARTAADIDAHEPGDGEAWRGLAAEWERYGTALVRALLSPFPPLRAGARLGWAARHDLGELVRRMVLPVRSMASERFRGEMAPLLLAGNALHGDLTPEAPPSGLLGWMLVALGQTVGFPVPVGGAGQITAALLDRLAAAGGSVRVGEPVQRVLVRGGRAVGVATAGGTIEARRAVLAACDAQVLYGRLVEPSELPAAFAARMARFQRASATVKVNYALSSPVPWQDQRARDAGTVHVADSMAELSVGAAELAAGLLPSRPFLLVGQTTVADPTRSPPGTESLWVYTHVPQDVRGDAAGWIEGRGRLSGGARDAFVARMEARLDEHAPGFESSIVARQVQGPGDLERDDASLVGGDISGGTMQLHQQLVLRPVPGLGRAETPITGLYLASSSAHPGGSVHGAGGANAAAAAIAGHRLRGARRAASASAALAAVAAVAARRRRR